MNGLGLPAQCCFCLYRVLVEYLPQAGHVPPPTFGGSRGAMKTTD